tara:strand:+ start:677 stop:1663 length:987 start_codon:yes stop_codon:yes gene_type:complete
MALDILYTLTVVLNGVFSIGFFVTFGVTFQFVIEYNELGDFPEALCENETICLFDKSGAYALIEAGIALLSVAMFGLKFCTSRRWFSLHGWFHLFFSVGFVVFFFMRLVNVGYLQGLYNDQGCKNPAVDGSPFERLHRYGTGPEIDSVEECLFNSFNQENLLYSTANTGYEIVWNSSITYTEAQRQGVLEQANEVLSNSSKFSLDTLPYYYDVYYWGCSHICLPTRYDMNILWVWLSLAACLGEVALAVLSFWLNTVYKEEDAYIQLVESKYVTETGDEEEKIPLIENPLIKEEEDDQTEISTNKGSSSSDPDADDDATDGGVPALKL